MEKTCPYITIVAIVMLLSGAELSAKICPRRE